MKRRTLLGGAVVAAAGVGAVNLSAESPRLPDNSEYSLDPAKHWQDKITWNAYVGTGSKRSGVDCPTGLNYHDEWWQKSGIANGKMFTYIRYGDDTHKDGVFFQDGQLFVSCWNGGVNSVSEGPTPRLSFPLAAGAWHYVEFECYGRRFKVNVDHVALIDWTDTQSNQLNSPRIVYYAAGDNIGAEYASIAGHPLP